MGGFVRARLFNAFTLTEAYIDELAESVYQCTACRRCKSACPMGVDHGLITHLARWILAEVGVIPKALSAAFSAAVVCPTEQIPQILPVICGASVMCLPVSITSKNRGDSTICS